jgi:hypothetical protein
MVNDHSQPATALPGGTVVLQRLLPFDSAPGLTAVLPITTFEFGQWAEDSLTKQD